MCQVYVRHIKKIIKEVKEFLIILRKISVIHNVISTIYNRCCQSNKHKKGDNYD